MTNEEKLIDLTRIDKLIHEAKLEIAKNLFVLEKSQLFTNDNTSIPIEQKPLTQKQVEESLLQGMKRGHNFIEPIYTPSKYLTKALGEF